MIAPRTPGAKGSERPLVITHTFNATRTLVFRARTSSTQPYGRKRSLVLSSAPYHE